jgi:hypothetical protein
VQQPERPRGILIAWRARIGAWIRSKPAAESDRPPMRDGGVVVSLLQARMERPRRKASAGSSWPVRLSPTEYFPAVARFPPRLRVLPGGKSVIEPRLARWSRPSRGPNDPGSSCVSTPSKRS